MKVDVLSVGRFSQRFKDFQHIFDYAETFLDRSDIGLWILGIFPAEEKKEDALFYEEALPTTDPRRFVCFREGKVIVGEADYYIDAEQLLIYLEDTIKQYNELQEKVSKFVKTQALHCKYCSKYVFGEVRDTLGFVVRRIESRKAVVDMYCRYCRRHLLRIYFYWGRRR